MHKLTFIYTVNIFASISFIMKTISQFCTLHVNLILIGCSDDPCLNDGNCTNGESNYTCSCTDYYTGEDYDIGLYIPIFFLFHLSFLTPDRLPGYDLEYV